MMSKIDGLADSVKGLNSRLDAQGRKVAELSSRMPESEKKKGEGGRKCYRCGSTEHTIADCPEPRPRDKKKGEEGDDE